MQIENCKLQIDERRTAGWLGSNDVSPQTPGIPGARWRSTPATRRRGITLVELLVAISIMVVLMAVAGQVMQLSVPDRRTREAAREINVFLGSARAQAMVTGRPCGVMFRRLKQLPQCVVGLDLVEVPPPYAGDTLEAVARLQAPAPSGGGAATVKAKLEPEINPDLVKAGDLVQLNYQGPLYTIIAVGQGELTLQVDLRQGEMLPWPSPQPVPYQIFRQPQKSAAMGLQLPSRAVIDLEFSGTDDHSMGGKTDDPVYIMFSPNGSLGQVYHDGEMHPVTEPVFLLVGKQERVPAGEAEDGLSNCQDMKNLWVTLNSQTGLVSTIEVAPQDPLDVRDALDQSRDFARDARSMGGR